MINLDEIEKTIIDLEKRDTSYATIERLAWLYIVKDHLITPATQTHTGDMYGSEFLEACSGVPADALLDVLNEHFTIIKAVYPKEYTAIIEKIREL